MIFSQIATIIEKPSKFSLMQLPGKYRGCNLKCPECSSTSESLDEFLLHCRQEHMSHDQKFNLEREFFQSRDQFKVFKYSR